MMSSLGWIMYQSGSPNSGQTFTNVYLSQKTQMNMQIKTHIECPRESQTKALVIPKRRDAPCPGTWLASPTWMLLHLVQQFSQFSVQPLPYQSQWMGTEVPTLASFLRPSWGSTLSHLIQHKLKCDSKEFSMNHRRHSFQEIPRAVFLDQKQE